MRNQTLEPTLLGAAWQYRWLVLFLAIGFAGLGWLYGNRAEAWTAAATISVEDPRTSGVFETGFADTPERYVLAQQEIASSRTVAKEALELMETADEGVEIDVEDLVTEVAVTADESSGQLGITYTATTSARAIDVVNAVANAYQNVVSTNSEASFAAALEQLDREIVNRQIDFEQYHAQINDVRNSNPNRLALESELDILIAQLLAFEPTKSGATPDEVAADTAVATQISTKIISLQNALLAIADDTELLSLQGQQAAVAQRISDLQTRRDQLAVDAELASNGVVLFDPAETAKAAPSSVMVVLGLFSGAVLGGSIALALARRRRRFSSRNEPERVFGVNLLSDVPSFYEERLNTRLPVVEAPASASAESFRFVAAAISLHQEATLAEFGSYAFRTLVIASSAVGEGKTVVTANAAYAAARSGKRVLVVDADLGNQQLTHLLCGSVEPTLGLSDVIGGDVALEDAITPVAMEDIETIDLLSRGSRHGRATDFMSSEAAAAVFTRLGKMYDLVLIDAPPVLQVAYATGLVRLADSAVVVVSHGQDYHAAEELKRSIDLIGTPVIGYVYNLAPLRRELALRAGSAATRRTSPEPVADVVVEDEQQVETS